MQKMSVGHAEARKSAEAQLQAVQREYAEVRYRGVRGYLWGLPAMQKNM